MKNLDPMPFIKRWIASRRSLTTELDALQRENEALRSKAASLQQTKAAAEKRVEELRREKEALRTKVASQKKTAESGQRVMEQLGAKITELRDENERLRNAEKARGQRGR